MWASACTRTSVVCFIFYSDMICFGNLIFAFVSFCLGGYLFICFVNLPRSFFFSEIYPQHVISIGKAIYLHRITHASRVCPCWLCLFVSTLLIYFVYSLDRRTACFYHNLLFPFFFPFLFFINRRANPRVSFFNTQSATKQRTARLSNAILGGWLSIKIHLELLNTHNKVQPATRRAEWFGLQKGITSDACASDCVKRQNRIEGD